MTEANSPHRLLVVDGQPLLRLGVRHYLADKPDFEIVGETGRLAEALRLLDETKPAVLLIDPSNEDGDGLSLLAHLKRQGAATRTLVYCDRCDVTSVATAVRAGATGFACKREPEGRLLTALQQVARGYSHLPADVVAELMRASASPAHQGLKLLSDRERQVFELLGDGLATKKIASQLAMSVNTVNTHRERIKRKMQLTSGAALHKAAVEWRLRASLPARP